MEEAAAGKLLKGHEWMHERVDKKLSQIDLTNASAEVECKKKNEEQRQRDERLATLSALQRIFRLQHLQLPTA